MTINILITNVTPQKFSRDIADPAFDYLYTFVKILWLFSARRNVRCALFCTFRLCLNLRGYIL